MSEPNENDQVPEAEKREATTAARWNLASVGACALFAIGLVVSFWLDAPSMLRVVVVVGLLVAALGLMFSTMWVMTLKTERKRRSSQSRKTSD